MDDLDQFDPAIVGKPDGTGPALLLVAAAVFLGMWLAHHFHRPTPVPPPPSKADCTTPAR